MRAIALMIHSVEVAFYTSLRLIQHRPIHTLRLPLIWPCIHIHSKEHTMEKITTASRIHPLMAAAALSVITVSAVGTAAIAGLLPNSKAQSVEAVASATPAQQLLEAQQLLAAQKALAAQQAAAQPVVAAPVIAAPVQTLVAEAPKAEPKPQVRHRAAPRPTRVVYRDAPQRSRSYSNGNNYNSSPNYQAQAPQPRQPNYVGIGAGAVLGGLLGNQVGGGNGKKLATVAGIIGGGYLGNEVANRYQR
jgi:hypothetical protein